MADSPRKIIGKSVDAGDWVFGGRLFERVVHAGLSPSGARTGNRSAYAVRFADVQILPQ